MKKILKNKNIYKKTVNNQTSIVHIFLPKNHNVNKKWLNYFNTSIYNDLIPVYMELEKDFQAIDVVDLIYYERWLNV